ncbi:hypothetical protein ACGFWI_38310 [Streptomyces sp. NPDC048434]|uniref:hypothetical protein n=1 Tax=Streptomyces sp. NPDC048434 TaxID=3365549 RepID=UPI0037145DE7
MRRWLHRFPHRQLALYGADMSLQVERVSVCFGVRTCFGVRASTTVVECMIVFRSGYGGDRVGADVLPQRYPFVTVSLSL